MAALGWNDDLELSARPYLEYVVKPRAATEGRPYSGFDRAYES